ncbi:MAG TPA: hypothetical protein VK657_09520 [Terriglobales bacterium]|nr:hypothetical protein [Terriglobales bacterium]
MDQDTDPEARDLGSGWAVVEGQAVVLVLVVDLALARQEVAEGAPACGSQAGRAVVAARGQELVAQVAEAELEGERVVVADMAAVPGLALVGLVVEAELVAQAARGSADTAAEDQEPAALVAGRAEVDLGVVGAEGPGSAGE